MDARCHWGASLDYDLLGQLYTAITEFYLSKVLELDNHLVLQPRVFNEASSSVLRNKNTTLNLSDTTSTVYPLPGIFLR